ncbi:MAG: hypothetical protein ABSE47_12365 [Acidimicrobiales bacterium]|jgi:hypothetical protein
MAAPPMSRPRAPGPSLRLSIPLLALGVVAAIVAGIGLATGLVHTLDNATLVTGPGTVQVQCRTGTYLLYVESGSSSVSATPSSVVVTGPGGATVALQGQSATETVTRDGQRFSGQIGFDVVNPGSYTIAVHTAGADLVVAPSFTTIARENLGWDILLLAGLLAGLAGLVLLIIGLVQRSRAKKRMAGYGGNPWGGPPGGGWRPPPGWQPSPGWQPPPGWQPSPPPGWQPQAPRGWQAPPGSQPSPGWQPPPPTGWQAQPGAPAQPAPQGPPGQSGSPPSDRQLGWEPPTGPPSRWGQQGAASSGPAPASPPESGPPESGPSESGQSSPEERTSGPSDGNVGWPRPSN